jgi:hypothetical protein
MGILEQLRKDFPERPITRGDRDRIARQCAEYREQRRLARIAALAAERASAGRPPAVSQTNGPAT